MKPRLRHAWLGIFLIWLLGMALYGYVEVSGIMHALQASPSPDLYANDLGFQVFAFVMTKGLASALLLGLALWGAAWLDDTGP